MNSIAVDIGTTWTKVAYYDDLAGKPALIELGREIRVVLPSLCHISPDGTVLVGEDASYAAERDSNAGNFLTNLKWQLHKPLPSVSNGRAITAVDVLSHLFARIRTESAVLLGLTADPTEVRLTCPMAFDSVQRDCLQRAARIAGFDTVSLLEEPVAAIRHHMNSISAPSNSAVLCDIGARSTVFTLLSATTYGMRPDVNLPPHRTSQGADDIEDLICDVVFHDQPRHRDLTQLYRLRLQLRRIKESFTRLKNLEETLHLGDVTLSVSRALVQRCLDAFLDNLVNELKLFAGALQRLGRTHVPLVLVGGGSNLPGAKNLIEKNAWPAPVFLCARPEFATVLGAVELPIRNNATAPKRTIYDPDKGI